MITLKKVEVFAKYGGDIDAWLHDGTTDEKSIISNGDWGQIESIIDELSLIIKKQASEKYMAEFRERVYKVVENEAVLELLSNFA